MCMFLTLSLFKTNKRCLLTCLFLYDENYWEFKDFILTFSQCLPKKYIVSMKIHGTYIVLETCEEFVLVRYLYFVWGSHMTLKTGYRKHEDPQVVLKIVKRLGKASIETVKATGSIPSRVILKTRKKKWYLIPPCLILSIKSYRSRVKWNNPRERVVPSPSPRFSCYWKGKPRVAFENSQPTLLLLT